MFVLACGIWRFTWIINVANIFAHRTSESNIFYLPYLHVCASFVFANKSFEMPYCAVLNHESPPSNPIINIKPHGLFAVSKIHRLSRHFVQIQLVNSKQHIRKYIAEHVLFLSFNLNERECASTTSSCRPTGTCLFNLNTCIPSEWYRTNVCHVKCMQCCLFQLHSDSSWKGIRLQKKGGQIVQIDFIDEQNADPCHFDTRASQRNRVKSNESTHSA